MNPLTEWALRFPWKKQGCIGQEDEITTFFMGRSQSQTIDLHTVKKKSNRTTTSK